MDEIYQHRAFDRARVRVLLTLDTRSVDLKADGVNRTDNDFALAWVRSYGRGRVFYSALGRRASSRSPLSAIPSPCGPPDSAPSTRTSARGSCRTSRTTASRSRCFIRAGRPVSPASTR
ncbi:MAG: ThuA domain-containing protein [Bryobacteraceae bacterium]|nr:ThuA domain-containing protein [Bryobacteraceae bacterium]